MHNHTFLYTVYIDTHTHIYIYICVCIHIYIYIYACVRTHFMRYIHPLYVRMLQGSYGLRVEIGWRPEVVSLLSLFSRGCKNLDASAARGSNRCGADTTDMRDLRASKATATVIISCTATAVQDSSFTDRRAAQDKHPKRRKARVPDPVKDEQCEVLAGEALTGKGMGGWSSLSFRSLKPGQRTPAERTGVVPLSPEAKNSSWRTRRPPPVPIGVGRPR